MFCLVNNVNEYFVFLSKKQRHNRPFSQRCHRRQARFKEFGGPQQNGHGGPTPGLDWEQNSALAIFSWTGPPQERWPPGGGRAIVGGWEVGTRLSTGGCAIIAGGVRGPTLDLRPTAGVRAIVTHPGPTIDGGGGRDCNTAQTGDRRARARGGGACDRKAGPLYG